MAGDWFPLHLWLTKRAEVVRISSATGRSPQEVVGWLTDFWSWASGESDTGEIRGVAVTDLPKTVGADADFWAAVRAAGWLAEAPGDPPAVVVPNWDRWLSDSAKRRAKEVYRKRAARQSGRPQSVRKVSAKCPQSVRKMSAEKRTKSGPQKTEDRRQKTDTGTQEEGRSSLVGAGGSCPEAAAAASGPVVPCDPPVLAFPTVGAAAEWHLTGGKLAEYRESFPGVDVLAECRKARQWLFDNPKRRKTPGGMAKYLGGWLGRCQDQGGSSPPLGGRPAAQAAFEAQLFKDAFGGGP